jgi:pimeloyl-ACP methyl ester carboxylesterase
MEPRAHSWEANGLTQHVLEWSGDGAAADADDARPTAIVVHGFQDAAATWDDVATILAEDGGLRVLAPDMRGFGDGPRVARGGYYYFPDYIADLAAIVRTRVSRSAPLFVVGHSMGATIVSYFAGAFPELPTKLALIDGVGPMDEPADYAPLRMRGWIDGVDRVHTSPERAPFATLDDAAARLARYNPSVDESVLRRRASQLARADDAGGFHWKHDPLHGTRSPLAFFALTYKAFARQVTCPVLHVSGGVQGHHVPDEEERLVSFPRMTRVTIEGGHALHWTRPRELGDALVRFWST